MLTHAKNPCSHLKDFVPNTDTCFTYEWTLKQTLPRGPTWRDALACGILTREVFIKAHGEFGSRKNLTVVVGCLASEYCKNKPQELEPIYLPNRETRPKDPI